LTIEQSFTKAEDMADEEKDTREQPVPLRYNFDTLDEYIATSEQIGADGRSEEAVAVMREATARFPDSARAHYSLGFALVLALKIDLAEKLLWEPLADEEELAEECQDAFQGAIERDPGMWEAYSALGTLLAVRGRARKAVEVWEKSLALNPDQPDVRVDLETCRGTLSAEGGAA
jgi:tetratricopeptide (TPR) repeat protein